MYQQSLNRNILEANRRNHIHERLKLYTEIKDLNQDPHTHTKNLKGGNFDKRGYPYLRSQLRKASHRPMSKNRETEMSKIQPGLVTGGRISDDESADFDLS